ncbi:unnamed protein product, partial [Ixodes persulcatus]
TTAVAKICRKQHRIAHGTDEVLIIIQKFSYQKKKRSRKKRTIGLYYHMTAHVQNTNHRILKAQGKFSWILLKSLGNIPMNVKKQLILNKYFGSKHL